MQNLKASAAMQRSVLCSLQKPMQKTLFLTTRHASTPAFTPLSASLGHVSTPTRPQARLPMSVLSLTSVMRSYFIMSLSSRPLILAASTNLLRRSLEAKPLWLFDVDRNPLLRWLLRHTFYAQFCTGESPEQNRLCTEQLRQMGYSGVIMEYAKEVLDDTGDKIAAESVEEEEANVVAWRDGLLATIRICEKGDFVGLKWSGMGGAAHRLLKTNQPPSPFMVAAMTAVCDAATAAEVKLLPAAEPQNAQASVDAWTLRMSKTYNKMRPGYAVLYNTYQTYLKSTAATLAKHLDTADKQDFTLGIKLVRGAYLHSETRHLIWDTKEETDRSYDGLASDLILSRYGVSLKSMAGSSGQLPPINMMIASHNDASVRMVRRIRDEQLAQGRVLVPLVYAQLYGMADEVSCELLQKEESNEVTSTMETPKIFKCATWGSMKDCLNYLLRRAAENKDALERTRETRDAMRLEIWRRAKAVVGID
ncbi:hypothetical protein FH972_024350 [Carpinus fangiana]|uniref:Proline dehydrogenase n=1 Tax=Carpinus fangiana TaxID=176857 RepID=A0A5N6KYA6_9ROSI|nr:hypothetical protein FH972_024350 [Carpinus fangiana]